MSQTIETTADKYIRICKDNDRYYQQLNLFTHLFRLTLVLFSIWVNAYISMSQTREITADKYIPICKDNGGYFQQLNLLTHLFRLTLAFSSRLV